MNDLLIVQGDARHIPLADNCVQCIVTSPPYWGLRKYSGQQELIWTRGPGFDDSNPGIKTNGCGHEWGDLIPPRGKSNWDTFDNSATGGKRAIENKTEGHGAHCLKCGAWRGAFGLEPSIALYVAHSLLILAECRRVLRPDGVIFWNLGDSYARDAGKGQHKPGDAGKQNYIIERGGGRSANEVHLQSESKGSSDGLVGRADRAPMRVGGDGLKSKDLCLIPARVALAAQEMGLWVRSDIIWAKPNPMPESCRDRPTDAYEHIFMFTKSARYYWHSDAVAQPPRESSIKRLSGPMRAVYGGRNKHAGYGVRVASGREDDGSYINSGVNLRNVWEFATQPYKGAHFATFPEELPRRCILAASRPGDLILDPFAGSGTVGRVAVELNRRAVLLDLAYHDHADKRTRRVQRSLF
jgi:DNA modification methylase